MFSVALLRVVALWLWRAAPSWFRARQTLQWPAAICNLPPDSQNGLSLLRLPAPSRAAPRLARRLARRAAVLRNGPGLHCVPLREVGGGGEARFHEARKTFQTLLERGYRSQSPEQKTPHSSRDAKPSHVRSFIKKIIMNWGELELTWRRTTTLRTAGGEGPAGVASTITPSAVFIGCLLYSRTIRRSALLCSPPRTANREVRSEGGRQVLTSAMCVRCNLM